MWRKGVALAVAMLVVLSNQPIAYSSVSLEPDNPILDGGEFRRIAGSYYWPTSNIREWLNSDSTIVQYTNNPPTSAAVGKYAYDAEPGFLYEFTPEEKNAIAITERRTFVVNVDVWSREGGSKPFMASTWDSTILIDHYFNGIHRDWTTYYYRTTLDKVFLLGPHEVYEYIQKRGFSLVKTYVGTDMPIQWWLSEGHKSYEEGEYVFAIDYDGGVERFYPTTARGVVPALHVKPTYRFSNGKLAKDLLIGEHVFFGRYKGNPIEWIVINKTNDGYALLWAAKALTIKPFDAQGDSFSYLYSNINFKAFDVSIKNDLQYYNGSFDKAPPRLYVVNENDLSIRMNDSYSLIVEAYDTESGLKGIILPDGTLVRQNRAQFEVKENKVYYFKALDNAGNYQYLAVPVGNINPEPYVVVEPSTTEWTNKDVSVRIFASADAGFYTQRVTTSTRLKNLGSVWPNYTTYTGKRIRISGCAKILRSNISIDDRYLGVGFRYLFRYRAGDSYWYAGTWPMPIKIPLQEITDTQKCFDVIYTVPGDYFNNLHPGLYINMPEYMANQVEVELTNLKYELLDKEDFQIEKIVLPKGTVVYASSYTDVLSESGTYLYEIVDNRGYVTKRYVTVRIDKVPPTLEIQQSPTTVTPGPVVLTVHSSDTPSGLKYIETPDGQMTNKPTFTYTVYKNGAYTFTAEDLAGNRTIRTVVISNINQPPEVRFSWSPTEPVAGDLVQFISHSVDPEGQPLTLEWRYQRPSGGGWLLFGTGPSASLVMDEPGNWQIQLVARDPYGFSDTEVVVVPVDVRMVAGCAPLQNPVWAYPGQTARIGCVDATTNGRVVSVVATLGGDQWALRDEGGGVWAITIPAPAQHGTYTISLVLTSQDSKGRTSTATTPVTLVVVPKPPTPGGGVEIHDGLPIGPGKVRLIG